MSKDKFSSRHSSLVTRHSLRGNDMSIELPPMMTLEALRSVPLFASLDDEAANELRNLLELREVASATPLFRSGDIGDALFLIESGRIRISIHDADGSEVTLADL